MFVFYWLGLQGQQTDLVMLDHLRIFPLLNRRSIPETPKKLPWKKCAWPSFHSCGFSLEVFIFYLPKENPWNIEETSLKEICLAQFSLMGLFIGGFYFLFFSLEAFILFYLSLEAFHWGLQAYFYSPKSPTTFRQSLSLWHWLLSQKEEKEKASLGQ